MGGARSESRRRRATALASGAALALAALLVLGCGTLWGNGGEGSDEEGPFRRVTPPVAFEMLRDSPDLPILDLRSEARFHGPTGHLRGAINVPLSRLHERSREIAWLRDRTFLVYCQSHECQPEALDILHEEGFDDAMMIHGGIEAWLADGFGTVDRGSGDGHEDGQASPDSPADVDSEPPPP